MSRFGSWAGLLVSLLLPVLAAGGEVDPPVRAAAAGVEPSEGRAQHKISPYVKYEKASRERARAAGPYHEAHLRLSVRGAQKASSH